MNIEFNSSSMLQSPVIVNTEEGTATLTYKNSGKDYTYNCDNNFVTDLQETITNDQSVGKFILSARADRRLTEVVSV
jgi:peptide subunit release factor 1 (eRF1)